jgi:hypothetical protein
MYCSMRQSFSCGTEPNYIPKSCLMCGLYCPSWYAVLMRLFATCLRKESRTDRRRNGVENGQADGKSMKVSLLSRMDCCKLCSCIIRVSCRHIRWLQIRWMRDAATVIICTSSQLISSTKPTKTNDERVGRWVCVGK